MEAKPRLHPLLTAAAISVIVLSGVGVAAFTGVLPTSIGQTPEAPAAAPLEVVKPPEPAVVPAPAPARPAKPQVMRASAPQPVAAPADHPRNERPLPRERRQLAQARCQNCGTVEAVREVKQKGEGTWMGPVAGGVGGAILGRQFGNGSGRTIMTVLGAAGGAYAGHEVEKHVRSTSRWEVSVRMDSGELRTVSYDTQPAWQGGQRVRYANGGLVAARQAQARAT